MISKEQVIELQNQLFVEAQELVERKGADYNREKQNGGDTLFSLRVASILGVVDSPAKSVLVRILDKVMRMISLTDADPEIKSESIRDTVIDLINYSSYWLAFKQESSQTKNHE